VQAGDGHVVRHDVEQLAEVMVGEGEAEPGVAFLASQLGVQVRVVDDVVAVGAAGRGLQVGRAVEVTDTKPGQISGCLRSLVEAEAGLQLDAIGSPQRGGGWMVDVFNATGSTIRSHVSRLSPA